MKVLLLEYTHLTYTLWDFISWSFCKTLTTGLKWRQFKSYKNCPDRSTNNLSYFMITHERCAHTRLARSEWEQIIYGVVLLCAPSDPEDDFSCTHLRGHNKRHNKIGFVFSVRWHLLATLYGCEAALVS